MIQIETLAALRRALGAYENYRREYSLMRNDGSEMDRLRAAYEAASNAHADYEMACRRRREQPALDYSPEPPANYTVAKWENGKVANDAGLPLWSGKGPLPAVGSEVICNDRKGTVCVVLGFQVEGKWLMVAGHRKGDDPSKVGNLAGAEILWKTED